MGGSGSKGENTIAEEMGRPMDRKAVVTGIMANIGVSVGKAVVGGIAGILAEEGVVGRATPPGPAPSRRGSTVCRDPLYSQ